jgi:hypothetical protein
MSRSHALTNAISLLTFVVILQLAIPARAQVAGATLSGTLTDSSGAVIPVARVTICNSATGVTEAATTNGNGFYTVPNLLPGSYEITAFATGFATQVQSGITLNVGAQEVVNITMRVGQVAERVSVTAEGAAVQLASSTVGSVTDAITIRELPLNGRDWTQLATLTPGVVSLGSVQPALSVGYQRGNRGFGTQLTIAGNRPQQNNYRVDGVGVNDYSNSGPGSVLGGTLGVDAIEEFSVLTSNYSAEYGRTSGGVVNAITRSGTNQFHGDAYEFLRNSALDARNFFDRNGIAPFKRNQFGAATGGPILKNRTFFFADYEGIRQSLGVTATDIVPSQDARNGILHNANGTVNALTVDPIVKPFLALWPLPNAGFLGSGDTGIFSVVNQQVTAENFATVRIDHHISDQDRLFGSYQYDNASSSAPDALDDVLLANTSVRQFVSIEESHNFNAAFLNSVRAGFSRVAAIANHSVDAINPLAGSAALGVLPGQYAPVLGVTGLTSFGGGLNSANEYRYFFNSFQLYDDGFLTKGKHILKFGFTVERIQENFLGLLGVGGNFKFNSLSDLLTNRPASVVALVPPAGSTSTVSELGFRQSIFGGYVQDDMRVRANLTVNLGLRYEMSTVPTDVHNHLSNLRYPTDSTPQTGNPFFMNPTIRNFEPRIGLIWDPFGTGKTAIRSGLGMFDVLPLPYEFAQMQIAASPFVLQGSGSSLPPGSFPTQALQLVTVPTRLRAAYLEFDPRRDYVMQWNFNVQRQLLPNFTLMVAYVGSRGVHQPFRTDNMNIVLPTSTPQGLLWPCGGAIVAGVCSKPGTGTPLNPIVGRIDQLTWSNNSFYDALQLQVTKRMSRGLQLQGSYTWGKSIDQGSASVIGNPFGNDTSTLLPFPQLNRGLSDFNVGQNLILNFTWTLSNLRSVPRAASWLLSGWRLGGIYQVSSGLPFTPFVGGDPLGLTNGGNGFTNSMAGPGCSPAVNAGNIRSYIKLECFTFPNPSTLLGNTGRNVLVGPGLSNLDFSLVKEMNVSEAFHVQLRTEFFNILNHANFLPPNNNSALFTATGAPVAGAGLIDTTSTTAREIQFALKVIW